MKDKLRVIYKDLRTRISIEERERLSKNIFKLISSNFELSGKNISIFLPIKRLREVNTWPLINTTDANFFLPVVKNKELKHVQFENKSQLKLSSWGIEEPIYGNEVQADIFDYVIVPLLAYDSNGNRIGYGAGFYDNFLKFCNSKCIFIGVSFFGPEDGLIETYPTDIPLHYCVTPTKLISFNS